MERVGLGLRTVATLIDTALLFVVGYLIAIFTGSTTEGGFRLTGGPAAEPGLLARAGHAVVRRREEFVAKAHEKPK